MGSILLSLFFLLSIASPSRAAISPHIGVCYGTMGNYLPTPSKSVQFLQKIKAKQVKIYNPDSEILNSLKGTEIQVTIMVPNDLIINISSNQNLSDQWVQTNVVPFYPDTMIRYLLVGNQVLSYHSKPLWPYLVPALNNVRSSVRKFGLHKVKVGTPLAMDIVDSSVLLPPSNATFRSDISDNIMNPLLQFLSHTNSYFFLDLYPYFEWASNPTSINLDYALLQVKNSSYKYTDPGSGLVYTNLLDQMLDSVVFSMKKLGYPDIRLYIAETGWPHSGDVDQIGANIYNAATYNRNVVKKFTAKPPVGTPARPGEVIPVNILSLFNENQKPGPSTERHFGLLRPNGSYIYDLDLTGKKPEWAYGPLPVAWNNEPYKGKVWCVIGKGANFSRLGEAIKWACDQDENLCREIQPGRKCYKPDSIILHASYVFSSYWAHFRERGVNCWFNGLAVQTSKDPSYFSCKFPSITI
ncbi:hypothetical protein M9H77_26136 [Catharanthus roseus]|uniref:Uncharacterized protein n=1 Tax=Catharanthus roseus TaxID=4058 RepID=A0ACC0A8V3_CATRO|nr:hypothetical protein M9H77_26136 [Catharanthus roseus]